MTETLRSYAVYMRPLLFAVLMLGAARAASAQTAAAKKPSAYDKIWGDFTEWYVDDTNPVVQRVLLSGRFHYDFATIDADQGDHSEWNIRRLRVGPRITLFRKFTLHSEVELDPQRHDPFYVRFTDFYVQWAKNPQVVLTVGKQSAPFTLDGAISSRELFTIDRSNLANNIWFPQEYLPGVSLSGRRAPWIYRVGLFSSGEGEPRVWGVQWRHRDARRPRLRLRAEAGRQGSAPDWQLRLPGPRSRQHVHPAARAHRIDQLPLRRHRWGARADLSAAAGYLGQSDMWAFQGMPFVNVTPKFQVVGRYTFIESDDPNGIRLATYESRVVAGRGDEYNELYVGANYYFYGTGSSCRPGVQFADMNDRANDGGEYSGVAWTTGLRVGW